MQLITTQNQRRENPINQLAISVALVARTGGRQRRRDLLIEQELLMRRVDIASEAPVVVAADKRMHATRHGQKDAALGWHRGYVVEDIGQG